MAAAASFVVQAAVPVFWAPTGILFVAVLLVMSAELFTKWLGMSDEGRRIFLWEQEITGKFLLITLIVLSLVLDLTVYLTTRYMPHQFVWLDEGYMFVTLTTEIWLLAAEASRAVTNVAHRTGRENVPPTMMFIVRQIQWVLSAIRRVDKARLEEKFDHPDSPVTEFDRWYDFIKTRDDAEKFARFMMEEQGAVGQSRDVAAAKFAEFVKRLQAEKEEP